MLPAWQEMKVSSARSFWSSKEGVMQFVHLIQNMGWDDYEIREQDKAALGMSLIGSESRSEEETNQSVLQAAKKIFEEDRMHKKRTAYFQRNLHDPLPARHSVLHASSGRDDKFELDLVTTASVGSSGLSTQYSDFIAYQKKFRNANN